MLTAERRQYILDRLHDEGKVLTVDLSTDLGVTEDTVRRDLRDLASERRLLRVHGGALPRPPEPGDYAARQQQAPAAKSAIARAAAELILNGQVVLLDGGTTTLQVAEHLPADLEATIITHSPPIAVALAEHPRVEVIMLGGTLDKEALVARGAATIDALRLVRADVFMLGVTSLHPDIGVSTTNLEEAYVKRAMIQSAAEVVALTSAEKLDTAAPYLVASLSSLTHLVTEKHVSGFTLAPYERAGITIIRA